MIRYIAIAAVCLSLLGCLDDYKFGNATKYVLQKQAAYCDNADPVARDILLAIAHKVDPNFPEDGLCTDLRELLGIEDEVSQGEVEIPTTE